MRYFLFYIVSFLYSIFSILKAESSDSLILNYPYINYTTTDGLPSNEVYCVIQDSKGYIWIGTDRGLVKYDGYSFKTYTTYDGLLNNGITDLFEDKQGNLWYSTLNGKIGYVTSELKTFVTYKYQSRIDSVLNSTNRNDIHFNNLNIDEKGNLYLCQSDAGEIRIDSSGNVKSRLNSSRNNLNVYIYERNKEYHIFRLRTSADYNVNHHLFLNDSLINEFTIKGYLKYSNPQITLYKDTLFIYDKQLYYELSTSGEIYKNEHVDLNIRAFRIGDHFLYNLFGDTSKQGNFYLSKSPKISAPKRKILDHVFVSKVFGDNNGGIWVGTLKNGIYYFPSLNHLVSNKQAINGIIPVQDNGIVFNSKRYFNFLYDNEKQLVYQKNKLNIEDIAFTRLFNNKISFNDYVRIESIHRGRGINPYKMKKFSISGIQNPQDSVFYYWLPKYIYKKDKNIVLRDWIPSKGTKRIESFTWINDSLSLFSGQRGLYINSGGEIYLKKIEGKFIKDSRVENLIYFNNKKQLLCSILGEGICVLDSNYNLIHRITKDHGLASNTINHLHVDQDSLIWVGTNNGINILELNDSTYSVKSVLGTSLVLPSPNITQLYREDSILFVGTDQGISIVDLDNIESFQNIPLSITGVKISGENRRGKKADQLEYDENDIEIRYLGISYNHHGQLKYRYRLLGLSDGWIETTERKATFLQLRPGNYIFQLEVQNEFGDWIALDNSPNFRIIKPYWKTWWFIGGGVLVGLLIIGGVLYFYISNLKKEKAFVEKEQVLSEELNESRQKALSSQLNPHFVFNSLNSIQNFILTRRTELSSDYLSTFSKLMRFVFENSKKLYVPLTDEMEALRLYLELEQVRHNHKFDYKIESKDLNTDIEFMPSLLVQPIIENAIWHGLLHKEDDDRLLEVTFKPDQDHLLIEVKDNGVGRGSSRPRPKFIKKQRSSGVELTKQRLDLLSQSTGLKTSFEIIDLFDEKDHPCGTLILISIPLNLRL